MKKSFFGKKIGLLSLFAVAILVISCEPSSTSVNTTTSSSSSLSSDTSSNSITSSTTSSSSSSITDPDNAIVDSAISSLSISYAAGQNANTVKNTFALTEEIGDVRISWASNASYVVIDELSSGLYGTVVRPTEAVGDKAVKLTATLTKGNVTKTKEFDLIVIATNNKINAVVVAVDLTPTYLANEKAIAVDTFSLPKVITMDPDVVITWVSSNTSVVSIGAKNATQYLATVTRPDATSANAELTLTATFSYDGKTEIKVFEIVVLADTFPVMTIAHAKTLTPTTSPVRVRGVVTATEGNAFYLHDDTGDIYCYNFGANAGLLVPGTYVEVNGSYVVFENLTQIDTGSSGRTKEFFVIDTGRAVPAPVTITLASQIKENNLKQIKFENLEFVRITDQTASQHLDADFKDSTGAVVKVRIDKYITSAVQTELRAIILSLTAGDLVTFDGASVYGRWGSAAVPNETYYVKPTTVDQITLNLTDAKKADLIATYALGILNNAYVASTSVTLPLTHAKYGGTIAWAFDKTNISNTGVITIPETGAVSVKATITITVNETVVTKTMNISVGELQLSTIKSINESVADNTLVKATGVITGKLGTSIFIQDATGGIYAYNPTNGSALAIGNKITISGTKTTYANMVQFAAGATVVVDGNDTVPAAVTIASYAELKDHPNEKVTMASLVLNTTLPTMSNSAHFSVNVKDANGVAFDLRISKDLGTTIMDAIITKFNLLVDGKAVNVTGAFVQNYNAVQQVMITDASQLEIIDMTTAQKAAQAISRITLKDGSSVTSNITLPTTGANGATISWSSSNPSVISNTGTVVVGEVDIAVTLTATVTIDSQPFTKTYLINVIAPILPANHILITQVYGAGGNSGATYNADFVELFNPTANDIDITGWTLQYASATGAFSGSVTLSGTIGAGKYFLVVFAPGTNGIALPTADSLHISPTLSMAAAAGKIALANSSTVVAGPTAANVVDYVGFGTATAFEGTGPTGAISTTTSATRISVGGIYIDNNDNKTDFEVGPINPRNSSFAG